MALLVADTSAVVSLATAGSTEPIDLLEILCTEHQLVIPERVREELEKTANYDDVHGVAAQAVLDQEEAGYIAVQQSRLDDAFPLDDGENAAVALANDTGAAIMLCDEFGRLGLIHASLTGARLATTPSLLRRFVIDGLLTPGEALDALDAVAAARSWDANRYAQRARETIEDLDDE